MYDRFLGSQVGPGSRFVYVSTLGVGIVFCNHKPNPFSGPSLTLTTEGPVSTGYHQKCRTPDRRWGHRRVNINTLIYLSNALPGTRSMALSYRRRYFILPLWTEYPDNTSVFSNPSSSRVVSRTMSGSTEKGVGCVSTVSLEGGRSNVF